MLVLRLTVHFWADVVHQTLWQVLIKQVCDFMREVVA